MASVNKTHAMILSLQRNHYIVSSFMPRKSRHQSNSRRRRKQTVWTFIREQVRTVIFTLREPFRVIREISTPLVQPVPCLLVRFLTAFVDCTCLFYEVFVGLFWRAVTFVQYIYLTWTEPHSQRSIPVTQRKRQVQKKPEEAIEPREDEAEERRISLIVSDMIFNFICNVLGNFPQEQAPSDQDAYSQYGTDSDEYRATTDSQDEDYLNYDSECYLDDNNPVMTASEIDHRKFSQESLKTWQSAPAVLESTSDLNTTGSQPYFVQSLSSSDDVKTSSDSEIKSNSSNKSNFSNKSNISNKEPTTANTHDKKTKKPASEMSTIGAPKDKKSRSPSPRSKTPEISDDDTVHQTAKTENEATVLTTSDPPLINEDKDLTTSESPAENEKRVPKTSDSANFF